MVGFHWIGQIYAFFVSNIKDKIFNGTAIYMPMSEKRERCCSFPINQKTVILYVFHLKLPLIFFFQQLPLLVHAISSIALSNSYVFSTRTSNSIRNFVCLLVCRSLGPSIRPSLFILLSVGRSLTKTKYERFSLFRSCPPVREWGGGGVYGLVLEDGRVGRIGKEIACATLLISLLFLYS